MKTDTHKNTASARWGRGSKYFNDLLCVALGQFLLHLSQGFLVQVLDQAKAHILQEGAEGVQSGD